MIAPRDQVPRFLVIAPIGRDAELIAGLLIGSGYPSLCLASIADAERIENPEILGIIITDEALSRGGIESLRAIVEAQPPWSDLPILLLTSAPSEPRYAAIVTQVRMDIRSLSLLDRPLRKDTLVSVIRVAHAARLKQLEMRDAALLLKQSDETLRQTEKLVVAGRLAATMAHEVNNPLTAIRNLLYLAEHSDSLDDARSFSRMAAEELERISEIIDHTLRFQRSPARPTYCDMTEIASSALALFRGRMRERNIRDSLTAPTVFAYCSPGEIRQAVVNLVGNAIDAMPNGGQLCLRIAACTLRGARFARLTVTDSGAGIRDDVRACLFRQFFTTKGSRGTGLGLWLTRDIVQRHHGSLRFRSRVLPPSGTCFAIYLPSMPPVTGIQAPSDQATAEQRVLDAA